MSNFKTSSINLNGARDAAKRAQLYVLKIKGIDIALETHSTQGHAVEWQKKNWMAIIFLVITVF